MATPIIQSLPIASDSSPSTSTTTPDFQSSVTLINPASTVTSVNPPASTVYDVPPPTKIEYIDVNPGDMNRYADKFCQISFPEDCRTNGYTFTYDSNFEERVVQYNISISPIPFCSPLTSTCEFPLSNPVLNCSYSLKTAWHNYK